MREEGDGRESSIRILQHAVCKEGDCLVALGGGDSYPGKIVFG